MYAILIERRAQAELSDMPSDILQRIKDAVGALRATPRPHGCVKLKGRDGWRIRVGDYRVLYDIDDESLEITIRRVSHRRDAYR